MIHVQRRHPAPAGDQLFNPRNLNRYSYALNNPLSFTDPSGFMFTGACGQFGEECGGTTTTTPPPSGGTTTGGGGSTTSGGGGNEGGSGSPGSITPTPTPAPTTVNNVTYLNSTINGLYVPTTQATDCPNCGFVALEGILHLAEGLAFTAVSLYALGAVLAVGPEGLIAAPVFVTTTLVGIDLAMFGVQEIQYGLSSGTAPEPDPLALVHLVSPNFLK